MPTITTRTTPNNTLLYVATCDYCGKEFAYPYQAQTENNVLSHMKYCKYKTRNAPQPTIQQTILAEAIQTTDEKLKIAEQTINELWCMVQEAIEFKINEPDLDDTEYFEPLPYPTRIQKPIAKNEEKTQKQAEKLYQKLNI